MNAFPTLMWLEFRKYSGWLVGFGVLLAMCLWLFSQILRNSSDPLDEARAAAFAIGLALLGGFIMAFIFFYGAESGREYRNGRWALLLGSPLPGWVQVASRVVFAFAMVTLFGVVMVGLMHFMLIRPTGLVIPLSSYLSLWLYGLGGLPLILFSLFGTFFTTAYLPSKTQVMAGFVAVMGSISLVGMLSEVLGRLMFKLPAWKIPMPSVDGVPLRFDEAEVGFEIANSLPTEGFVALLLISVLLFYVTSRMWTEVEA